MVYVSSSRNCSSRVAHTMHGEEEKGMCCSLEMFSAEAVSLLQSMLLKLCQLDWQKRRKLIMEILERRKKTHGNYSVLI